MTDTVIAPAGGAVTPPAGGPAAPPATWYSSYDAPTQQWITGKGWHAMDHAKATEGLIAHARETERAVGAPRERVVILPEGQNPDEWKAVWQKLGYPADPTKYDFTGLKVSGGDPQQGHIDAVRKMADQLHLSPADAKTLAAGVFGQMTADLQAGVTEHEAALALEKQTLAKNWGANEAVNKMVAQNAAKALGVTTEEAAALENVIGYARTMEMFRQIGSKIGEDKFVRGGTGGNDVMTLEGASAQKAELMQDKAWVKRYLDGGSAERKQMEGLNRLLNPSQGAAPLNVWEARR